jgi:HAD superfamily hydrolase (TIGR01484 family)
MEENRALLASDMDGTVIPLELNPRRREEISFFREAVEEASHLTLAYVTGRDLPLALKGIRDHGLPEPDILVCDVGTSLYHATPSGFGRDVEYLKLMEEARGGLDVRDVRHELTQIPNLLLQPEERQTESKLSYHLPPEVNHKEVLVEVQEVLNGLDGKFQAVYSVGAPHGRGLLDLLPTGVAKDFAVRYLHDHTGIAPDRLVYAGDSGNDLAAMLTGFNVVVVGNATPGLKEELLVRGRDLGILDRLFFSKAFYASGVMEGCRYFGIL